MMEKVRKISITLDHLPSPELNPNKLRRLHWSERHRLTLEARQEAGWLAKVQWKDAQPMEKARISYEFQIKGRKKHDIDNLLAACKAYLDGIIDAGVIYSDDIEHLEFGMVRAVYSGRDRTVIMVEEVA